MFRLFRKNTRRLVISGNNLLIDNRDKNLGVPVEEGHVFTFGEFEPAINIYESGILIRTFIVQTLESNPDLAGQFFHASMRILPNSAVMIDGIISGSKTGHPEWSDRDYEAIRFQPFYLSDKNDENAKLVGLGLFARGLHYAGTVTPTGVRCVCVCDNCNLSFTLQHFHAGFSEVQYFYSGDAKETLVVPYGVIDDMPKQLQQEVDPETLKRAETKLPDPVRGEGRFHYYNAFICPHCLAPFIDFDRNKKIRPGEYYGNTLINVRPTHWPS
jgi:hypothetical protein